MLAASPSRSRRLRRKRVRALILGYPGVTSIHELLFTFAGPGRLWVVARVDIDDGLHGGQVKSLAREIESSMKCESDNLYRVDVVAIDRHRL